VVSHHKAWTLIKAEKLIRSGRIPLDDMRGYGEALQVLLVEYDRLQEQEQGAVLIIEDYDRLRKVESILRTLINVRQNPTFRKNSVEQVLWDELRKLTQ
jgi:hypothetical protein